MDPTGQTYLSEERHTSISDRGFSLVRQLDKLATLGSVQAALHRPRELLGQLLSVVREIIPFDGTAIYLMEAAGSGLEPALFAPDESADDLAAEFEELVWDGSISWALTQEKAHVARTATGRPLIVQSLQLMGEWKGVFMGRAACRMRDLTDASLPMLSLALKLGTAALVSACSDDLAEVATDKVEGPSETGDPFHSIVRRSSSGVFRFSSNGRILLANPAMARLLGYGSERMLRETVRDIRRQVFVDQEEYDAFMIRLHQQEEVNGFECRVFSQGSSVRWLSLSARLESTGEDGSMIVEGMAFDITERKAREERLARKASMDDVTGIPNRSVFNTTLRRMHSQAQRSGQGMALLFIDLDRFKQINDCYGHQMGDKVLYRVAQRILRRVRAADLAARLGGDEFCVILHDVESRETAIHIACELIQSIARKIVVDGIPFRVGASIGIHCCHGGEGRPEDVIRKADKAMYRAKNAGRNCCFVHGENDVIPC